MAEVKSPTAGRRRGSEGSLSRGTLGQGRTGIDQSPELEQAKKSLGIDQGDPKTKEGLKETRRGFNITHPMGNFASPELGRGSGNFFY